MKHPLIVIFLRLSSFLKLFASYTHSFKIILIELENTKRGEEIRIIRTSFIHRVTYTDQALEAHAFQPRLGAIHIPSYTDFSLVARRTADTLAKEQKSVSFDDNFNHKIFQLMF